MMREKVHKVIFENQSSAIRGLEAICQHLISWFVHNTLKQTNKQTKNKESMWASKQANKKDISIHFCLVSACGKSNVAHR